MGILLRRSANSMSHQHRMHPSHLWQIPFSRIFHQLPHQLPSTSQEQSVSDAASNASEHARIDGLQPNTDHENTAKTTQPDHSSPLFRFFLVLSLVIMALVPRLLLALKLDVVTDEVIYIQAAKMDFPLLTSFKITSPFWIFNYEHPALIKLLIGFFLHLNASLGQPFAELQVARLPSILMGTALVVAVYLLGRAPFGRLVAFAAALSLTLSPWLSYFSALAYLDMGMTTFVTIAYLLSWHALRRPPFYLLIAVLVGLGGASKYTAVLIVPAILLFTVYYFFVYRSQLPPEQRPPIPWRWWLAAFLLAPLTFLAVDPAIWRDPLTLLIHSFHFEWEHSLHGHLTFVAGQYNTHVPSWAILYILSAKISAFITIPALLFVLFALIQLVRFQIRPTHSNPAVVARNAFAAIWLLATVGMFSLLNIVVGTHYYLPLATPIVICGACGLATLLRSWQGNPLITAPILGSKNKQFPQRPMFKVHPRPVLLSTTLLLAMAGSHLIGLITIPQAEGYTSELFAGENQSLQVAYPGYRDALQWLTEHGKIPSNVGLVALPATLNIGNLNSTWYAYNLRFTFDFLLEEVPPELASNAKTYTQDYLVWPMHLLQRGYTLPKGWPIIHRVSGGATTYCFILAHPATTSQGSNIP